MFGVVCCSFLGILLGGWCLWEGLCRIFFFRLVGRGLFLPTLLPVTTDSYFYTGRDFHLESLNITSFFFSNWKVPYPFLTDLGDDYIIS